MLTDQRFAPEWWAQYCTVGPYGYADTHGEEITEPTVEAAHALVNQPEQLADICWVNLSVAVEEGPNIRIGESLIATSRRSLHRATFQPVSTVIEQGKLTKHTARWVGHLATGTTGRHIREYEPDRFEELLVLAYRAGALERET